METDCYCTSLRTATRKITALYDAALSPVAVNVAQWGLLKRLDAETRTPVSIQELADSIELERSTVARNVRVLQKAGLVTLGTSPEDRRTATIVLTDTGVSALRRGQPMWEDAQEQVEQLLGHDVAGQLRSVLLSV